jgi:hypothetical protein
VLQAPFAGFVEKLQHAAQEEPAIHAAEHPLPGSIGSTPSALGLAASTARISENQLAPRKPNTWASA